MRRGRKNDWQRKYGVEKEGERGSSRTRDRKGRGGRQINREKERDKLTNRQAYKQAERWVDR